MSDVEDYRKAASKAWCEDRRLMNPAGYFALSKADAALAELEADLDVMTKRWLHFNEQAERWSLRHQQADKLLHEAEAELRKWKADFRAMETVALDHERELAALKGMLDEGLTRIVQCHMYPMQVPRIHPAGFATLATVDGLVASEVLSEVHDLRARAEEGGES